MKNHVWQSSGCTVCRDSLVKWTVPLVGILLVTSDVTAAVWYVDRDNLSGMQDGLRWATAYNAIQPAIDAAYAGGGGEVWVAEGIYDERRTTYVYPRIPSVNNGALLLKSGIELYGGFSGIETVREERDWRMHPTVIDGSTARDGYPSYQVVWVESRATILDSVIVRGGRAEGDYAEMSSGGGIGGYDPAVTANCTIKENFAVAPGAGMVIGEGTPVIVNCTFQNNESMQSGGAVDLANSASRPEIVGCWFIGNTSQSGGGGAIGGFGGHLTVRNSVFVGNRAGTIPGGDGYGGAIHKFFDVMTLENCVFFGNHASTEGAALRTSGSFNPEMGEYDTRIYLHNCTFWANVAGEGSAVLHNTGAVVNVRNSVFWNNTPLQIVNNVTDYPPLFSVHHCLVQGGYEGEGNLDLDPQFVDAVNGDVRLRPTSPCIDVGTVDFAPAADIRGVARPQGAGVDIGTYEYQAGDELDIDASGGTDAVDVQLVINGALGLDSRASSDVDGNSVVDAIDVQLVINAALGL
ncbi:MAG: hypothetical protein HY706_21295 [Candidatus Hydrogenedentes bacterium]|nr:hypothetical protein [Candidatus Hydrogenedentota bacterium]